MMLSSKEDVRARNKKNGCRKGSAKNGRSGCRRSKNRESQEDEINEDNEDLGSQALAVSPSNSEDDDEDMIDCRTANRDARKSQLQNNYIPRCTHDGRYEQIQCYKVEYHPFSSYPL